MCCIQTVEPGPYTCHWQRLAPQWSDVAPTSTLLQGFSQIIFGESHKEERKNFWKRGVYGCRNIDIFYNVFFSRITFWITFLKQVVGMKCMVSPGMLERVTSSINWTRLSQEKSGRLIPCCLESVRSSSKWSAYEVSCSFFRHVKNTCCSVSGQTSHY